MIKGIFHVNINVTNFERSLAFYQMLGFKVVVDLKEGGSEKMGIGLGMPNSRGRAALLMLGEDRHATRIDLIEWKSPKTEGKPYLHLAHAGIARIALHTKGVQKVYEELKAKGVKFLSEPQRFDTKAGKSSFVCFHDPDGTVLELIEFE
ncbi:MAG TPA: VOC family protein [Candidatus Binataceae bacterium]